MKKLFVFSISLILFYQNLDSMERQEKTIRLNTVCSNNQKNDSPILSSTEFIKLAKSSSEFATLKQLLEEGANPNQMSNLGTALYQACLNGAFNNATLLLSYGANPNIAEPILDDTPLIAASKYGQKKIVTLLLKNKANPNMPNKIGETPLAFACQNYPVLTRNEESSRLKIMQLIWNLLIAGADPKFKNNVNITIIESLIKQYRKDFAEIIEGYPDKKPTLEQLGIKRGGVPSLKNLCIESIEDLKSSLQLSISDLIILPEDLKILFLRRQNELNVALVDALKFSNFNFAYRLLAKGAVPNYKDENGYTPLMFACEQYERALKTTDTHKAGAYKTFIQFLLKSHDTVDENLLNWAHTNQLDEVAQLLKYCNTCKKHKIEGIEL